MELTEKSRSVTETPRAAIERGRSNPRLAIAAIAGTLLLIAWIAWAIYVANDQGANAGLGVVLSWPALLAALVVVASPFVGIYFLVTALRPSEDEAADDESDEEAEDDDEPEEGDAEEEEDEPEETDPDEEPPSGEKETPVSG